MNPREPDEPRVWFVDPLTGERLPTEDEPAEEATPPPEARPGRQPRRRVSSTSVLGVLALVTVLSAGVATVYSGDRTGQGRSPELPIAAPTQSSSSAVRTPVSPAVRGWQPVVSDDQPFAFDVPSDWTVEDPSVAVGYETPTGDLVTLHGVARFKTNFCTQLDVSARALAGFTTIGTGEVPGVAEAAEQTSLAWAEAAYGSADGTRGPRTTVGDAGQVDLPQESEVATAVTTTVTPADSGPCGASSVTITAVALPLRLDSAAGRYHVFLVLADQGFPEAVTTDLVLKIAGSIRRE
ncbi:hypothetical protein [Amycolatopsis sp. H20-H5]|uniref:hypothetical protein n=1 Tax=Amycolatopsis sp. H20-H5 TaxID=3046309 RepID=UPI002DB86698|nr:hypothetical protein [Amycolatopsis sp. H20-H5]MEC3980778.1 hypothetical protein [Amycolatopsis sp. H20-H5]